MHVPRLPSYYTRLTSSAASIRRRSIPTRQSHVLSRSPHCRRESVDDHLARTHAVQLSPVAVIRDEIQNGVALTIGHERVGLKWPVALWRRQSHILQPREFRTTPTTAWQAPAFPSRTLSSSSAARLIVTEHAYLAACLSVPLHSMSTRTSPGDFVVYSARVICSGHPRRECFEGPSAGTRAGRGTWAVDSDDEAVCRGDFDKGSAGPTRDGPRTRLHDLSSRVRSC